MISIYNGQAQRLCAHPASAPRRGEAGPLEAVGDSSGFIRDLAALRVQNFAKYAPTLRDVDRLVNGLVDGFKRQLAAAKALCLQPDHRWLDQCQPS